MNKHKKMNIDLSHYPKVIIDRTNEFIQSLDMIGSFGIIEATPEYVASAIAHIILEQWLINGDIEISEEQFHKAINLAEINYAIEELKNKGLVSTFDDETYFLTEKGKEFEKNIKYGKGDN